MEIDLSRLDARTRAAVDGQFTDRFHRDLAKAITRQTRTAKARHETVRFRDDFVPQHEIDPFIDSLWRQFYGHDYTENKDLMRFLVNRNPEIFVKARSGKIQTGYTGRNSFTQGGGASNRTHNPVRAGATPAPATKRNKQGCRFDRGTLALAK